MADTTDQLTAMHDAIKSAIAARFPGFQTVEFYRDDEGEAIPTPACLLEMTECEPQADILDGGTGQLGAMLRFEARIIMQVRDQAVALELRRAAVAMATWLHQLGRFPGAPSDPISVISAQPDDWMPANGGFRAWLVEFGVPVRLGIDAWADTGGVVPQSLYSFKPDIGIPHKEDYQPIEGAS